MLGIGFEERSEAIDFGIGLQEVRKVHQMDDATGVQSKKGGKAVAAPKAEVKKDFSLKKGETIHVDIGMKGTRRKETDVIRDEGKEKQALFSIAPPPFVDKGAGDGSTIPFLQPPPSAFSARPEKRRSGPEIATPAADLGFDDGEFGEFQ